MTMTSAPRRFAAASGLWLVLPQSTVTIRRAPSVYQPFDGLDIRPIAFKNPVRNVNHGIEPMSAEKTAHQGRRTRTIDIVIAKNRDLFTFADSLCKTGRAHLHILQEGGIGQHRAQRRRHQVGHIVKRRTARG